MVIVRIIYCFYTDFCVKSRFLDVTLHCPLNFRDFLPTFTSIMKKILTLTLLGVLCAGVISCAKSGSSSASTETQDSVAAAVVLGTDRTSLYLDSLAGKRVAIFTNHTGLMSDSTLTADMLIDRGVNLRAIFSPEHGFTGTADAGEHVSSSSYRDVPVISLYGPGHGQAMRDAFNDLDVILVDIQDVGLRYYTYYCTMLELMDQAAAQGKKFIVLDRPNPNGMYVDGPILDMNLKSGVGQLPIPIVHGLTFGEMALMINGEGWLADSLKADLMVVPCENYTHQTRYQLPVAPSPNLATMKAIYLYPSLCYFEGTKVSLGRGTDKPFLIYGHPAMKGENHPYEFTPESRPGAKNPPLLGEHCYGVDLSGLDDEDIIAEGINLDYVIDAYRSVGGDDFFTAFFEKLIGRNDIRGMIQAGKTNEEIRATWAQDVTDFKAQRQPYLLYAE